MSSNGGGGGGGGRISVRYINTSGLQNTARKFNEGITQFNGCVREMTSTTNELLNNWQGDGRNQFETQYTLLKQKLNDISDTLYDIYDALVESETTYLDADESVAKEISASAG